MEEIEAIDRTESLDLEHETEKNDGSKRGKIMHSNFIYEYLAWENSAIHDVLLSFFSRDLELHRTPGNISGVGATGLQNGYQTLPLANGHSGSQPSQSQSESTESAKMRDKLTALDDLKELLEEPVEEQVSQMPKIRV